MGGRNGNGGGLAGGLGGFGGVVAALVAGRRSGCATLKPAPRVVTFSVQLDGARAWGVCLIDHELRAHSAGAAGSIGVHDYAAAEEADGDSLAAQVKEWWWPVGFCLLTRLPVVPLLEAWLVELHRFLQGHAERAAREATRAAADPALPLPPPPNYAHLLAPHLARLAVQCPRPVDNVLAVEFAAFGKGTRRLRADVLAPSGLPAFAFDLQRALQPLGARACVKLLGHALGERKLLLHAQDLGLVTPLAEALCCLLYPMQWSHAYVPILPKVMLEILEAPQPYMVGIRTDWLR